MKINKNHKNVVSLKPGGICDIYICDTWVRFLIGRLCHKMDKNIH